MKWSDTVMFAKVQDDICVRYFTTGVIHGTQYDVVYIDTELGAKPSGYNSSDFQVQHYTFSTNTNTKRF